MYIESSYFILINIAAIVILAGSILLAYKNGFIYQLLNLIAFFVSIVASIVLAPTLAEHFPLFKDYSDLGDMITKVFLNSIIWYFIVFIVFKIILAILLTIAKMFSKLPIIGKLNKILGALLGAVTGTLWVLVLSTILSTPLFINGQEAIDHTIIRPLSNISNEAVAKMSEYVDFDAITSSLGDEIAGMDDLSEAFGKWLDDNGFGKR